jgi:hypothetical protein
MIHLVELFLRRTDLGVVLSPVTHQNATAFHTNVEQVQKLVCRNSEVMVKGLHGFVRVRRGGRCLNFAVSILEETTSHFKPEGTWV